MKTNLPIGYYNFCSKKFLNYQLNRWYSEGFFKKEILEELGKKIHSFETYVAVFSRYASENPDSIEGIFSLRAAEFLCAPEKNQKSELYSKFIHAFDRQFGQEYERIKLPYLGTYLSLLKYQAQGKSKGTIIAMGGFDSLIEEFHFVWKSIAHSGYDVIAFEGPGQGRTLREFELKFDHDYEKPVSAILDYFNLNQAAILGLSMGGYWAIRAAAYEPRISQVIAMPAVYDWLELTNNFNRKLVHLLLKWPKFMNVLIKMKMLSITLKHTVKHALFITGHKQPVDTVKWMLGMNAQHVSSEKIKQDVLLIVGENDNFQPPKLSQKQAQALVNAKSVELTILLKKDFADRHCQMGNLQLAVDTILNWLNKKAN